MESKDRSFRQAMLLIAFGVVLFAAVTHLQDLWQGIQGFIGLLSPILLGGGFALILNVPMRGFERLFARLDRQGRMKEGARTALSLVLTILIMPLILFVIFQFVLPQFFAAINDVIALVRANTGVISEFAAKVGLDPDIVNQKVTEILQWVSQNLGSLAGTAVSTIASVVGSVASAFMSLMMAIYLLANKTRVKRQFYAMLYAFAPRRAADEVRRVGRMFIRTFSIFLSRQCLEACILGCILFLGMVIFGALCHVAGLPDGGAGADSLYWCVHELFHWLHHDRDGRSQQGDHLRRLVHSGAAGGGQRDLSTHCGRLRGSARVCDADGCVPRRCAGGHSGHGADYPGGFRDLSTAQGSGGRPCEG